MQRFNGGADVHRPRVRLRDLPVALERAGGPVGPHDQRGRGRQLAHPLVRRQRPRHRAETQEGRDRDRVDPKRGRPGRAERVQLGGERPLPVAVRVVERLDPEAVPGQPQLAGPAVPQGEREHAPEAPDHLAALAEVEREHDLGVGVAPEPVPLGFELRAELGKL